MKKRKLVDFINESPDVITIGSKVGSRKKLFQWNTGGRAYPFGYVDGVLYIGRAGATHGNVGPNGEGGYAARNNFKYPGRIWTEKKVISFWQYPSTSELKHIIKDLEHTFNNVPVDDYGERKPTKDHYGREVPKYIHGHAYGKISINGNWKLDVPAVAGVENYDDFSTRTNGLKIVPADYDTWGYLYNLSTVLSNKPLKGVGEKLRSGSDVNVDKGQQHLDSPLMKKNAMSKMSDKQKKDMYNYFKAKGRLSPDEERMWKVLNRESFDIYFDGERFLIKENPDNVVVGGGVDYKSYKTVVSWNRTQAFAFGYKNGKMGIGKWGDTHGDMGGRRNLKYPGRFWPKEKIISFWTYPPRNKLMKVLNDINQAWNSVGMTPRGDQIELTPEQIAWDKMQGYMSDVRADQYGFKLRIDTSWKMDIASEEGMGYRDVEMTDAPIQVANNGSKKSYLYSIGSLWSDKPLKGIGEKIRSDKKINVDHGQEHMKPAALKNKNIQKLDAKGKKELWDYFHEKGGGMDKEEKRMYAMLQRNMKREGVEMYLKNGKLIVEDSKKLFTFDNDRGIVVRTRLKF